MKQKIVIIVLSLLLCFTFGTSAFATVGPLTTTWRGCPTQKQSSYSSDYVKAIQIILINYNTATHNYIMNNGGMDGSYWYSRYYSEDTDSMIIRQGCQTGNWGARPVGASLTSSWVVFRTGNN